MVRMLAHNEAGLALAQAAQQRCSTKVPVCYPHLLREGRLDQRGCCHALALVRILTRHDVAHQGTVRVVEHQRVARASRAAKAAQRGQPLVTGGQVVAVQHAQLPAGQAGLPGQARDQGRKPLGAALHQRAQHWRLAAIDFVVQRRQ